MNFEFGGWQESPVQLFDQQRWAECLHATIQAFNVIGDAASTQAACEDTGLLHELAHLASGVPICTHTTLAEIRGQLDSMTQWEKA